MATPNDISAKMDALFKQFIKGKKILIADESASSRAGLAKLMSSMGAMGTQLVMCSNYGNADEEIKTKKPEIVICDFDLGRGRGLDLLQKQRSQSPESKKCLFIIVTGNTSQAAVAQSAEEDVDAYILKPYNIAQLRMAVIKAASAKAAPTPYFSLIQEGKTLLVQAKYDEAGKKFKEAESHDPKPSLALFYQGQTEFLKKIFDVAQTDYTKGLEFNHIHYKCMVGLFDLLMSQKLYVEAYDLVKKISRYFPGNPQRLNSVLRLAITNGAYEDIEKFYQSFTNIEERNEEMIRYVCAALVVTGKHYLQNKHNSRALELFTKASVTAGGRTKILREIITALCEFKMVNEAKEFLVRFPLESHKAEDYLISDLLIGDQLKGANYTIEQGRKLIQAGMQVPSLFRAVITRSREVGHKDYAEGILDQATKLWPDFQLEVSDKKAA